MVCLVPLGAPSRNTCSHIFGGVAIICVVGTHTWLVSPTLISIQVDDGLWNTLRDDPA